METLKNMNASTRLTLLLGIPAAGLLAILFYLSTINVSLSVPMVLAAIAVAAGYVVLGSLKEVAGSASSGADRNIGSALKVCQANVMMADNDLKITYMNDTVISMLKAREHTLREALPSFSVNNLIGTCVDDFHVNPAHQRALLSSLSSVYKTDLNVAGLTFGLIASPWLDEKGVRVGTVVEWEDKTDRLAQEARDAEIAAENSRIRSALDVCDTSVMMADEDLNIVYMNSAVKKMMGNRETQIKTELPNFSVDGLMGYCVDGFHKNPSHQRGMLRDLRQPYSTKLTLAGLTFNLIATPLWGENSERSGTVVEWVDITDRLAEEAEAAEVAAVNKRIRGALDVCDTSVMMADEDLNIIYLNEAVKRMMTRREAEIRQHLPSFSVSGLMGYCVDGFHKTPSHQRTMLRDLRDPYSTSLNISGLTFNLIATPLWGDRKSVV